MKYHPKLNKCIPPSAFALNMGVYSVNGKTPADPKINESLDSKKQNILNRLIIYANQI